MKSKLIRDSNHLITYINNHKELISDICGNRDVDSVISDCILKLFDLENVSESYVFRCIKNTSIDYFRYNRRYIHVDDYELENLEDHSESYDLIKDREEEDEKDLIEHIKLKLKNYSEQSKQNHFEYQVFKYFYFENISINKLSKDINIHRPVLTKAKNKMLELVKEWSYEWIKNK